ncbi:MAG TPA: DNA gyrase/topoisomerase IV subunit A [Porphyromonadaceae bacterium]|nr:DNA gyrase/topoisomerase IV subunit A [Porphyromonadaceae bacterium]
MDKDEEAEQNQELEGEPSPKEENEEGSLMEEEKNSSFLPLFSTEDGEVHYHLGGMYRNWFLDYASYVILERAVPHLNDGLKPVQRRILHSMKRMDDGRYNKVANIIGHTMQFHPHGDASIGDALVQLGQKELLIDCQGNWGNILTGDSAAAPRYIEARLSKFALDVVFNPKTTHWKLSYDGRNKEPITLPVKFPLLLAQGVEGIAVGLSSKILPHNFNELLDASIAYLKGEDFYLYPDFQTGGFIDVSKYNDGERGGKVKVRAKIEKQDSKTLVITNIPYGETTGSLIDSILSANDKGKIKIRRVDDNTAKDVEILVHLQSGVSSDKTIDALYAFTNCEVSLSPNCCVISNDKPQFLKVSDVLKVNTDNTLSLLKQELEIEKQELLEQLQFSSLEKIFIEERMYKNKEFENALSMEMAIDFLEQCFKKFIPKLVRDITRDDLLRLMEIKMARILKFNSDKATEYILSIQERIKEINHHLDTIVQYTIDWFLMLKGKYGKNHPRLTEIRSFDYIEGSRVAENNEKLYVNYEDGFIGTSLKKDNFIAPCSDIDDAIVFFKDGKYKIVKVAEKLFVGKGILYVNIFKRNDTRTIYNVIYRDGKTTSYYVKRFFVTSISRDKEYDLTQGKPSSKVVYFSANPNGEAEIVRIILKPSIRIKRLQFDRDFGIYSIKNKNTKGSLLTRLEIYRVTLHSKGNSTLGGIKVWFDPDVKRINSDAHGELLGEFEGEDRILVMLKTGEYYTTDFDFSNHYDEDILFIKKFEERKVWSLAFYDGEQRYYYIKRFCFEPIKEKQNILGEGKGNKMILLTEHSFPLFKVTFGGEDRDKPSLEINVEEFIGVKNWRAHGKRISTLKIQTIEELPPLHEDNDEEEEIKNNVENDLGLSTPTENGNNSQDESNDIDDAIGQLKIF